MRIYHGSKKIVSMPICDQNNGNSDFGEGFYATWSEELAREWAAADKNGGFLNIFEIDTEDLKLLDLSNWSYDIRSWIALILSNRMICLSSSSAEKADRIIKDHLPDLDDADIIIGYRADNINFSTVMAFIEDRITLEQLIKSIQNDDPGDQVLLRTPKAISSLTYIETENVEGLYYSKRLKKPCPGHLLCREYDLLGELTACIEGSVPDQSVDSFLHMFTVSGYAGRFESGDPEVIYGLSGIELCRKVMEACGLYSTEFPSRLTLDREDPAYRSGYLLASYLRERGLTFEDVISYIPFSRFRSLSEDPEEESTKETFDIIDKMLYERQPSASRLQTRRKRLSLSQKELAACSGVNIRTLQQYETGAKDINRAAADKVAALSKALCCDTTQLLEPVT